MDPDYRRNTSPTPFDDDWRAWLAALLWLDRPPLVAPLGARPRSRPSRCAYVKSWAGTNRSYAAALGLSPTHDES